MNSKNKIPTSRPKKIWVDLDNSPHVPFFLPIIEELKRQGFSVLVTARDCFQVCELADLFGLEYKRIGRHYGKRKIIKLVGLGTRAVQLARSVLAERPDLAISHGSRAQLAVSALGGIPSIVIVDYEFARGLLLMKPKWVMVPDVIPDSAVQFDRSHILRYPGIKEDVYAPRFRPDPAILKVLKLTDKDLVVTARPPANEAHYHNPESDELFAAAIDVLSKEPRIKVILLPRNQRQEETLRNSYGELFAEEKLIVPKRAVDGLNLIWYSDLVISGGGTMNREAAALGVPVYSVFRGKIGAVDRYLANCGRLVLLESAQDVKTRLILEPRLRPEHPENLSGATLTAIVNQVSGVLNLKSVPRCQSARQLT